MNPNLIPAKARGYIYALIGAVSLAVGAVQVGYASINEPNPTWLTVALAVTPFLAAGLGYTAATHTPKSDATVEPYEPRHLDADGDGNADGITFTQPAMRAEDVAAMERQVEIYRKMHGRGPS